MKRGLLLGFALALNGCIGTALLRDVDTTEPYPDLHSVPDPHPPEDFKKIDEAMRKGEQESKESIRENKEIRSKRGLAIESAKPSPLFKRRKKTVKASEA